MARNTGQGVMSAEGEADRGSVTRVLLAEADTAAAERLVSALQAAGVIATCAVSGAEALACLADGGYRLIAVSDALADMAAEDCLRQARVLSPDSLRVLMGASRERWDGPADAPVVMSRPVSAPALIDMLARPVPPADTPPADRPAQAPGGVGRLREPAGQAVRPAPAEGRTARLGATDRGQIAVMLRRRGFIDGDQLAAVQQALSPRSEPAVRILRERGWLNETAMQAILTRDFLFESVDLNRVELDRAALDLVSASFCERQWVLPLRVTQRRLHVAMADPLDEGLLRQLHYMTGLEIEPRPAEIAPLRAKIAEVYGGADRRLLTGTLEEQVREGGVEDDIEVVIEERDDLPLDQLLRGSGEPPATRLVNSLISDALRFGASDIHIQPRQRVVVVRYRIDGVLIDKAHLPVVLLASIVARIKVMAGLDIAERRRPQDGRIMLRVGGREIDLRISCLPTITGEKVVMRILDRNGSIHGIDELMLAEDDLAKVELMVSKPHGLILATGPTGSGKTTTLYSLLHHDVSSAKNYVTIEDPVEYSMEMAGQVHVQDRIGVTFAKALRAILRQDPDVILVGEIRDEETAEVALHAAMTGHLVYSTLHTNSAVATVMRLFDLGMKPYLVASALEGIISQRLVRRVCQHCSEPYDPDPLILARLGRDFADDRLSAVRGRGCHECFETGFRGRVGLFEVLVPDIHLRRLIGQGATVLEIDALARKQRVRTLLEDARDKVRAGLTTPEEVYRVLGAQEPAQPPPETPRHQP